MPPKPQLASGHVCRKDVTFRLSVLRCVEASGAASLVELRTERVITSSSTRRIMVTNASMLCSSGLSTRPLLTSAQHYLHLARLFVGTRQTTRTFGLNPARPVQVNHHALWRRSMRM